MQGSEETSQNPKNDWPNTDPKSSAISFSLQTQIHINFCGVVGVLGKNVRRGGRRGREHTLSITFGAGTVLAALHKPVHLSLVCLS